MADYSGHSDPWTTSLTDVWLKRGDDNCWGAHKDFDGPFIEVPRDFLGLLIDGYLDGIKRNRQYLDRETFRRPVIKWNKDRQRWQMNGGYHLSNDKTLEWLKNHGYLDTQYKLIRPIR